MAPSGAGYADDDGELWLDPDTVRRIRDAGLVADPHERLQWFSAHTRFMLENKAQAWFWPTETAAEAAELESRLIEICVLRTAAPPHLNGKAWWSDRPATVMARAWWAARRLARPPAPLADS